MKGQINSKGMKMISHNVRGTLDVNEFTASIKKCSVNMEHPSGIVI